MEEALEMNFLTPAGWACAIFMAAIIIVGALTWVF